MYVGKCLAEAWDADQVLAVTLTYGGGDHVKAAVLHLEDVQKMLKRMRKDGYNVRYIVAGEYGSKKGRAHWHGVLFLRGKTLPVVGAGEERPAHGVRFPRFRGDEQARINWRYWRHPRSADAIGYAYFDDGRSEVALRYILKYVLKDVEQAQARNRYSFSKNPVLGASYYEFLARRYAAHGLAPANWNYQIPGARGADGRAKSFYMQGAARRVFVEAYLEAWAELQPGRERPWSQYIEDEIDRRVAREVEIEDAQAGRFVPNSPAPSWRQPTAYDLLALQRRRAESSPLPSPPDYARTVGQIMAEVEARGREWRKDRPEGEADRVAWLFTLAASLEGWQSPPPDRAPKSPP